MEVTKNLPRYFKSILRYEDIKYCQKSRNSELSISDYRICCRIILGHNLLPPSQVTLHKRDAERIGLELIDLGVAQKAVVVLVINTKDARKGLAAIFCNPSLIEIVERCYWVQHRLLGLEKDLVHVQEILGAAFDALSNKLEAL